MLKTNISAFGVDAMLDAYSVTIAEMAAKAVATPYKFLMGCARNAKAKQASHGVREGRQQTARCGSPAEIEEAQARGRL